MCSDATQKYDVNPMKERCVKAIRYLRRSGSRARMTEIKVSSQVRV